MSECVVYWLHDDSCADVMTHGYVGVTFRFPARVKEHRKRFSFPFEASIIFRGTLDECLTEEARLRPETNIGWNNASGGKNGRKHTDEAKAKIRAAHTGRKLSEDRIERIRESNRRRQVSDKVRVNWVSCMALSRTPEARAKAVAAIVYTPELRAKLAAGAKGKKRSAEHRTKIAEANRLRVTTKETRAKMSAAARRRVVSEATREKMRANMNRRWAERKEGKL